MVCIFHITCSCIKKSIYLLAKTQTLKQLDKAKQLNVILIIIMHMLKINQYSLNQRERGGVVAERRTPNREVLGSIPTGVIVLCH